MSPGYQALMEGAAWFDASERARLRLTGVDRVRLLHALASNVIEGLEPGCSVEAFFLTPQGQIVARCQAHVEADSVLVETDAVSRQPLIDYLDSYIIMDDVTVTDETDGLAAVAILGPRAEQGDLPDPTYTWLGSGYWAPVEEAALAALVERLEAAGYVEATAEDRRVARVEKGKPEFGVDYGPKNLPHETQLLDLVSFDKGCYVGQEIVERVHSQGQVNRLLCWLAVEATEVPEDLAVRLGDQTVGELTSALISPQHGRVVGFSVLRRQHIERASELSVGGYAVEIRPRP